MSASAVDPVWEDEFYSQGHHFNRYPYDQIVSFIYRWRPRDRPISEVRLLETGCGAGNNLWFAAREGFQVAGIDGSASAIAYAKKRFADESLTGDLRVGSFSELPWEDDQFDLVFDRGALVCVGHEAQRQAVAEARRVLKPGGIFLYNGFSDRHSSGQSGTPLPDGRVTDMQEGTLAHTGSCCFTTRREVDSFFATGWHIERRELMELEDLTSPRVTRHSEWRVFARKI